MALIGKIRQRSGLLIFLIGASIVGFLIMDATNSQFSVLKGRKDSVGKVNGEKILYADFARKNEENLKNMEEQMRGQPVAEEQRNYVRTQTWNQMVNDIIFGKIYEKLGINVTPDELTEMAMGENASPYIKQDGQFRNPQTGQFDPAQVRLYLSRLDQDPEGVEPGTIRRQWLKFENLLKENQYQQKYNNLISKALYVPAWMAEMSYNDQNRFVNFKYVQLPYSDVNDASIKVSDDELKKYIQEHSAKYKQDEETRKIEYVAFEIQPSTSDTMKALKELEDKRAEFAKGTKPSEDSLFVKLYSETPFDEVYYDKDKVVSPIKDSLFARPVGSLVGPYLEGGKYKLAKISDRKMISDSVKIRDIKFSFAGISTQEVAAEKFRFIDSIFKQIDSLKGDFGAFAAAYSDDPTSKANGGNVGWIKQGEKEKAYNDLLFYRAQKGKTYRIPLQAENAIHIIQVVEDKPSKMAVLATYLTKEITPSAETQKNIYAAATTFASDNQTEAKFKPAGEKLHAKTVGALKKDAFSIEGLGSARDVVKWAFTVKKGEVSPVYTVEKKHVVALVENIIPKGLPEVDEVREPVKAAVIKEKKFELLAKKINDAKASSIDDLATKLGKSPADAERVTFASPGINGMYEPKVVGTALAMQPGKVSMAVEGNGGVYAVQTMNIQDPPKMNDYSIYSFQQKQQLAGKARFSQEVEKKLAKIDDFRFDFF